MHHKAVLIASSSDATRRIAVNSLADIDVELSVCDPSEFASELSAKAYDLAIVDLSTEEMIQAYHLALPTALNHLEKLLAADECEALLVILSERSIPSTRLPITVRSDFIREETLVSEISLRAKTLLWPGEEGGPNLFNDDEITLNLATYQVKVKDEPLDLTYLEYELLAFLMTHPGKTYSRDALLRRVWGFDYLGGSRTVDVHVRRLRSKLGPEMSQKLETIRGFGYLWNAR